MTIVKELHAPTGHQKWEIKTVCTGYRTEDVDLRLAQMGEEGWEPWGLILGSGGYDIYFKRPKLAETKPIGSALIS